MVVVHKRNAKIFLVKKGFIPMLPPMLIYIQCSFHLTRLSRMLSHLGFVMLSGISASHQNENPPTFVRIKRFRSFYKMNAAIKCKL